MQNLSSERSWNGTWSVTLPPYINFARGFTSNTTEGFVCFPGHLQIMELQSREIRLIQLERDVQGR